MIGEFFEQPPPTASAQDQEKLLALCLTAASDLAHWIGFNAYRKAHGCPTRTGLPPRIVSGQFLPPTDGRLSEAEIEAWRAHLLQAQQTLEAQGVPLDKRMRATILPGQDAPIVILQ